MENLSHSRRPNSTTALPSKTGCNNGGGKSLYDDVFGGQPRFGVPPTLSPRAEDYAEIFGAFHAPRSTSIPVLDLPLVGGSSGEGTDDDDVFFDARSGSGFDYGDVFGGYNAPDFAVSFEDLMTAMSTEQSDDGRRGDSSDDAWSPADAESLSDGSDHSAKDPRMSNGDSYDSIDGTTEFNISYNKASLTSNGEMPNGTTHVTRVHPVPGYTVVVNKTTLLPKEDDVCGWFQESDDGPLDINFNVEMMKGRQLRKTMSQQANSSSDRLYLGNDVGRHGRYSRSSSLPNETFVTISNVSLKTQPSQLPPPSRPPPPLDVRKRGSSKSSPNSNSVASEGMVEDDLPTYFDVEVDGSSSAAASAAAMKEAMEKAQVKLSYAKDMMERKREGFPSRTKKGLKNGRKDEEKMSTKIADGSDTANLEPVLRTHQREHNGIEFPVLIVNPKVAGQAHSNSGEEKHGRDSMASCGSDKEGAGEWKEATQYYELVRANKSRKAFDRVNGANSVLQNAKSCEVGEKGKGADMDALWQHHHENGQNFKAFRADHEMERHVNVSEVSKTGCEWVVDNSRSEPVKMAQSQNGLDKKGHAASEASRWEEEKFRTKNQPLEDGNKQVRADFLQKHESMVDVEQKESKCGTRQTMKDKEKVLHLKESDYIKDNGITSTGGREESEKTEKDPLEREENGEKLGATFEQQEKETKLKLAVEHEEKEKMIRHLEREESERRQKNALERDDDEERLREAFELKENEKRQKEALEKPEKERRIKGSLEKEENDRRQREALECKEDDRRQREICEGEENEKKLKESLEKEENKRRQREGIRLEENERIKREVWERKENEKRLKEALEQEENEKKQTGVLISEKNEKMHARSSEKECMEGKINGDLQRKEIGNRLEEECLKEEKDEMFRVTWAEVSETGVRETSEPEEAEGLSREACKETATKFDDIGDTEEVKGSAKMGDVRMVSNQAFEVHSDKSLEAVGLHSQSGSNKLEQTMETAQEETKRIPTELRNGEKVASVEVDRNAEVSGLAKDRLDHGNNRSVKGVVESGEAGHAVGQRNMEKVKSLSSMDSVIENQGKKYTAERGDRGCNIKQAQCTLNQEDSKDTCMADKVVKESFDAGRKEAAAPGRKMEPNQPTMEVKGSIERTAQQINASQGMERIVKNLKENLPSEEKEAERTKRERQIELERLQRIEDEREREREREKDRISVDRITLDARERAYAEARERAERAAVERATTESRQRALNEARERLEKACAEAREKSLSDRTSVDARLRAERAAVERATAEARERAFERTMAERAASAPRNGGMRPSPASSDLQGQQPQNAGSANGSRHPYSSAYIGVEGESAERCKARLERHRRTAERAAKALAEKNMRDLLAQREQAERNRLAETLDADVKRWSSGKEGNLRALLSTLQYILGPDSGWQPIPLTEVITSAAVKKAYRKATLCVHPDKLQQRGASIQQKYICEKVFDLLKEAWNKFNSEER